MHTLVGGVVVHIAHHHYLAVGVVAQQRVFQGFYLLGGQLTIIRGGTTAGPVAYHSGDMLVGQGSAYGKEATGGTALVFLKVVNVGHQFYIAHGEEGGVVKQGTVDTTLVGTFNVHIFISTLGQRLLGNQRVEHLVVFNLAQTNEGAAHARQYVGAKFGQCARHVAQLVGIFHSVPTIRACRQKLNVVLTFVMASVEKVFLVVEGNAINRKLFLRLATCKHKAQKGQNRE